MDARLTFRFLNSPTAIVPGPDGRIARLTVAENILVSRDGGTSAKTTDKTSDLEVDTLIFAIGDMHDQSVGLPFGPSGYVTNSCLEPGASYEVFDPGVSKVVPGTFVVGWARKPSEGLVGIARHDGEVGAARVLQYLSEVPASRSAVVRPATGFPNRCRERAGWSDTCPASARSGAAAIRRRCGGMRAACPARPGVSPRPARRRNPLANSEVLEQLRCGNSADQILLFGTALSPYGECIQNSEGQRKFYGLILTIAHIALAQNLHPNDCLA